MPRITVLVATADAALFQHVHRSLLARPEARLIEHPVSVGRILTTVRRDRPDILLVDGVSLGERAMNFIRRVSALELATRSLMLHTDVTEQRVSATLHAGGAGCIARYCTAVELIRALRAIDGGELWASRRTLAEMMRQLRAARERTNVEETGVQLSRREREIADWMRSGMTNKEIGRLLGISDMTVKTHAHNIFHKLEVTGRRFIRPIDRPRVLESSA